MKLILMIFILCGQASADTFRIAGENISFENQDGLLLKDCENKKCEALKTILKFKRINLKRIRASQKYSSSIGSDVCKLAYKANSLIGIASNNDQRAFCVFKDSSVVEINSLSDYLVKNNIVQGI